MTRSKLLVFGMIVVGIGVLSWFAFDRRGESPVPADSREPSASVEIKASGSTEVAKRKNSVSVKSPTIPRSDSGSKATSVESTADELPSFSNPRDQTITSLRALADAGNNDARIELSRRLAGCTARALRTSRESDERDRRSIEEDRSKQKMDESWLAGSMENYQNRIAQHAAELSECEALSSEVRESWLDPIDQAAQSGNTYAMRTYAGYVVKEYDSQDAVVADVDRAIARRDKARDYLRRAVSLGDAEGLADLANAYFDNFEHRPQLYAADNYQAYMYAYAGSLAGLPPYRGMDWLMTSSAKSLDSRQITDARKQGKLLFDACCRKH